MKTDDEMYQSLLLRFRDAQAQRKKRQCMALHTVPVLACLCLAAGSAVWYRQNGAELPEIPAYTNPSELPVTEIAEPAVTAAQQSGTEPASSAVTVRKPEPAQTNTEETQTAAIGTAVTEPEPAAVTQTEPAVTGAKPVQTVLLMQTTVIQRTQPTLDTQTVPPVTVPPRTVPPAEQTAAPPDIPGSSGNPGAVFTRRTVSFAEAQELFGHPLIPCGRDDFQRYQAGIVSRNGNAQGSGAFCLSVTYEFADGAVTLTDWDRMNGSDGSPDAEQISYCGKLFYVERPDAYEDSLRIAYYAAGYDPFSLRGIEYQAVFGGSADLYAVMDLMLSLETETE